MNKKILSFCFLAVIILTLIFVLPNILVQKGKTCYKKKDMACAADCFKYAHLLAPTNLEYEYFYTKTLTKLKPTYKIQKELFAISKNAKSQSAKNLAKSTINNLKTRIVGNIGNNYIEQTPSDADIVHWNKESFPLNVYIKEETNVPAYFNYAIKRALALWTQSVSFVNFKYTDNKANAQIIIEIKQTPPNSCVNGVCKYVTGYTTPIRSGRQLKNMTIILYDKNPSGKNFSEKEIFHTIAHELGHALGIMGHSYSSDDLMYPTQNNQATVYDQFRNEIQKLSGRDINTVELLYRIEPTVTDKFSANSALIYAPVILGSKDDMLDRKIREAQDYIRTSPAITAGYIDLASAYLQKGKVKAAEDTLLRALNYVKSNDEAYMIYYNLAIVACTGKHFSKAQGYVNKAKQMKNSPELAEIEYLIKNRIVPAL